MNDVVGKYKHDLLVISTTIGLLATLAAPWLELEGVFQSWRIVEWNTFWQGANAYLLGDVVAANYPIRVEFSQPAARDLVSAVAMVGVLLAGWHLAAALVLARAWVRSRPGHVGSIRTWAQAILLLLLTGALLLALNWLLSIPSGLSLNVDFRVPGDTHSTDLVWSQVSLLPVAPAFAIAGWIIQVAVLAASMLRKPKPCGKSKPSQSDTRTISGI